MNKTVEYYNENIDEFFKNTVDADLSDVYAFFLKYIPSDGYILDLGCGSGRDSLYFKENGYKIKAIDGSNKMCEKASEYIKEDVQCIEFDNINYDKIFDGVWACASLLHVEEKELINILEKVIKSLKSGGYLYISFKQGTFTGIRNKRMFTDLTEESLAVLVKSIQNAELVETMITEDARKNKRDNNWINGIIRRI